MAESNSGASKGTTAAGSQTVPVVIDLGKYSRNRVKKLRKGSGVILEDAGEAIAELQADGKIDAKCQPVVLIVREKPKSGKKKFKGVLPRFMKI
ncbi:hypothetical protein [Planktotalea sp.]|uniref:DUF6200 domain-containing protein n=1 Tax=Planktotalea sp. TaxID=2029877 RepID=UPI0032994388